MLTWHFRGTASDRRLGEFEAPKRQIGLPSCVLGVERPPDVPISPPICERSTRVRLDSSLNVMYLLGCDICRIFNLAPNEDAFDGLSASTNACSATSHHICHVSATCRNYGVECTSVAPPLASRPNSGSPELYGQSCQGYKISDDQKLATVLLLALPSCKRGLSGRQSGGTPATGRRRRSQRVLRGSCLVFRTFSEAPLPGSGSHIYMGLMIQRRL